jgi:GDPmannose 4,6-dehydratase
VNGQDGSYLAEYLLGAGWYVTGVGRQPRSRYIAHPERFDYRRVDLAQQGALSPVLAEASASHIYYLAAVHGAAGFEYESRWQEAVTVNLGNVQLCLEHMRTASPSARLLYASSLKAFGTTPPKVISEATPRRSQCLYSITKNGAKDVIDYYRDTHRLRASVLYLFNHDSPRRPAHFVLPRMVSLLARALRGQTRGRLRSLDFACDWGSAAEFMQLGHRLLENERNIDYVMATGRTWTGGEFIEALFASAGLDWHDHVKLDQAQGSVPVHATYGDITCMRQTLGTAPRQSALDVAHWILRENEGVDLASRAAVRRAGAST